MIIIYDEASNITEATWTALDKIRLHYLLRLLSSHRSRLETLSLVSAETGKSYLLTRAGVAQARADLERKLNEDHN